MVVEVYVVVMFLQYCSSVVMLLPSCCYVVTVALLVLLSLQMRCYVFRVVFVYVGLSLSCLSRIVVLLELSLCCYSHVVRVVLLLEFDYL